MNFQRQVRAYVEFSNGIPEYKHEQGARCYLQTDGRYEDWLITTHNVSSTRLKR